MGRAIENGRAGIGLLAVVMLLLLMALGASLAIPAFFSQAAVTLDNACIVLARDIRSAQNRAAWSGSDTLFEIDLDGRGYRIADKAGQTVERYGSLGPYARRFDSDGVFEGVSISDADLGGDHALFFDAQARAWEGGSFSVHFGDEVRRVRVRERFGDVRIVGLERAVSPAELDAHH